MSDELVLTVGSAAPVVLATAVAAPAVTLRLAPECLVDALAPRLEVLLSSWAPLTVTVQDEDKSRAPATTRPSVARDRPPLVVNARSASTLRLDVRGEVF